MAQLQELESAACDVIQNVKQIQDLRHARLSVIGGLALMHYLPEYRSTDNINFITNISTSPSSLKKRLVEQPESPFFQRSQALFYKAPRGQEIRVDISPEWLSPYLPESAVKVEDISRDEVPYISLTDLIVFKLDSSGLRSNPVKKERDAQDAAALVDFATHKSSLQLSEKQEQVVEEALCDVAKCGTKEKGWWERRMGLTRQAADGSPYDSGGRGRKQNRPHSKSDPSPSRGPLVSDPNAAWHYERLDHAHIRRFNSLHSSRGANRPGIPRSSSQRMIRDTGFTMTQPKTTHASYQLGARRSGLSSEISTGSNYYTLEPGENLSGRASPAGYFDGSRTPPGGLGTVTEHAVGVRRSSKSGYFDLTPGATPSAVSQPRRPPGLEKRSVTFLL
ncbi:hypothetical protein F4813DRAFT_394825 [Daldinia decipiens]|uniref:uncharacterized protein n=1 Tax=Daldinia decipiens TaxID=326647 RepID=UPI0020C48FA8|nr:uncharacterized protein F4813DRAFT_394825 [Daldinia decipiens]KAI1662640.1 hypothetical protein F4813DRAFT_394825 [Daldinia decipiens]